MSIVTREQCNYFNRQHLCERCRSAEGDHHNHMCAHEIIPTGAPGELASDDVKEHVLEHVDHPAHYGGDTVYETIKVLRAWLTPEEFAGFCKGNAIKYLSRAGKKEGQGADRDRDKAAWYLREMEDK